MVQLLASGCGKTKSSWSVELSSISLCEYNIIFFLFTLDVYPLTLSTFTIIYTCIELKKNTTLALGHLFRPSSFILLQIWPDICNLRNLLWSF